MKTKTKKLLSLAFILTLVGLPHFIGAQGPIDPRNCEGNEFGLSCRTPLEVLSALLKFLLAILTILGVIGFVMSGIIYITAGGAGKADVARRWLQYSILGILVGLSGYIIVITISSLLGGVVPVGN